MGRAAAKCDPAEAEGSLEWPVQLPFLVLAQIMSASHKVPTHSFVSFLSALPYASAWAPCRSRRAPTHAPTRILARLVRSALCPPVRHRGRVRFRADACRSSLAAPSSPVGHSRCAAAAAAAAGSVTGTMQRRGRTRRQASLAVCAAAASFACRPQLRTTPRRSILAALVAVRPLCWKVWMRLGAICSRWRWRGIPTGRWRPQVECARARARARARHVLNSAH